MADVVNVPDVPGVPNLNFAPGAEQGIELLDADGATGLPSSQTQWGIYLNGQAVVKADSVVDFTLKKEWALSDYPVEKGAFADFDKVRIPYDARIRFSSGGSLSNRSALLNAIDAIAGDLNLYDAVTPEAVYSSCNITHYDYRRTSSAGQGLVIVDVWLLEVRVVNQSAGSGGSAGTGGSGTGDGSGGTGDGGGNTVSGANDLSSGSSGLSDTQLPSGTDPVNGGTVQPTAPTVSQTETAPIYNAPSGGSIGFRPGT